MKQFSGSAELTGGGGGAAECGALSALIRIYLPGPHYQKAQNMEAFAS